MIDADGNRFRPALLSNEDITYIGAKGPMLPLFRNPKTAAIRAHSASFCNSDKKMNPVVLEYQIDDTQSLFYKDGEAFKKEPITADNNPVCYTVEGSQEGLILLGTHTPADFLKSDETLLKRVPFGTRFKKWLQNGLDRIVFSSL